MTRSGGLRLPCLADRPPWLPSRGLHCPVRIPSNGVQTSETGRDAGETGFPQTVAPTPTFMMRERLPPMIAWIWSWESPSGRWSM